MDASEYKHVVLGLIFLKYISDAFEEIHAEIAKENGADPEDRDEYISRNIFWVPKEARWEEFQTKAKLKEIKLPDGKKGDIGGLIDAGMIAIEKENPSLKGIYLYQRASRTIELHWFLSNHFVDLSQAGIIVAI